MGGRAAEAAGRSLLTGSFKVESRLAGLGVAGALQGRAGRLRVWGGGLRSVKAPGRHKVAAALPFFVSPRLQGDAFLPRHRRTSSC